jgi:4-hydroxybenzoate polyprenyltransferase
MYYWFPKVFFVNAVHYEYSTARFKPRVCWPPVFLGYLYTAVVLYRLYGVLADPEEVGGGYLKNAVSTTVYVLYASGHIMGYVQMKNRNEFAALCNTMMIYEVRVSKGT